MALACSPARVRPASEPRSLFSNLRGRLPHQNAARLTTTLRSRGRHGFHCVIYPTAPGGAGRRSVELSDRWAVVRGAVRQAVATVGGRLGPGAEDGER